VTTTPKAGQSGQGAPWDARGGKVRASASGETRENQSVETNSVETNSIETNRDLSQLREASQCNRAAVSQDLARPASGCDPLSG
jgi:hypothetical protein